MPELCRGFKVTFKVYDALLLLGIAVYTLAFFAVTWRLTYIFKHFRLTNFAFVLSYCPREGTRWGINVYNHGSKSVKTENKHNKNKVI